MATREKHDSGTELEYLRRIASDVHDVRSLLLIPYVLAAIALVIAVASFASAN